jgi:hypothetical protein
MWRPGRPTAGSCCTASTTKGIKRRDRCVGSAFVWRSQAVSFSRVTFQRAAQQVFAGQPLGGVSVQRVRTIRGVRGVVPSTGRQIPGLHRWWPRGAMEPRRQRDLLPHRRQDDGGGRQIRCDAFSKSRRCGPCSIFASHPTGRVYDVSRDGRFLITTPEQQSASDTLTLVVNWPALLRK